MSANSIKPPQEGFTLVELVTIMVLIGILAAVALPRFNISGFQAAEFRDQTVAALRYAQKTAVSHRRLVCANFTVNSVSLEIASGNPASACDTPLNLPTGQTQVSASGSVVIDTTDTLFFQPSGRITSDGDGMTVVSGTRDISGLTVTLYGGSGHVQ